MHGIQTPPLHLMCLIKLLEIQLPKERIISFTNTVLPIHFKIKLRFESKIILSNTTLRVLEQV